MLTAVNPKLPMRDKSVTKAFYMSKLGFADIGNSDYPEYLILKKDNAEVHFFLFKSLVPTENYGQLYFRTDHIEELYQTFLDHNVAIHPSGSLQTKPWGQKEFSILDPDNNLLTFGENM